MGREEEGDMGRAGDTWTEGEREKYGQGVRETYREREKWGGRKHEIQGEVREEKRREIQGDNDTCREGGRRRVKRERLKVERGGKEGRYTVDRKGGK
jgi:hypothetical protein